MILPDYWRKSYGKKTCIYGKKKIPFYETVDVEFTWNKGLAKSQKQKNIKAIHEGFLSQMPGQTVLEISSKSMQDGGTQLSAFSLAKFVPEIKKSLPVECIYQAGKIFQNGGPYKDLMNVSPHDAKTDARLKTSGHLISYVFDNKKFPLYPQSFFYDYLYLNALLENQELAEILLKHDAFTDIEFCPSKGISCQAKSAAVFVSLCRLGIINQATDPESFLALYGMYR